MKKEKVPTLRYGQGNFHVFKEALSAECILKYGDAGKLIKLGTHFEEKRPEVNDFDAEADLDLQRALYIDAMKNWRRNQNALVAKRSMMFTFIWTHLSAESQEEVRSNTDYKTFSVSLDPEKLWQVVEATHGVHSVSKVTKV